MKLEELRLLLAEATQATRFAGNCYFAGGCVRDQLLKRSGQLLDADIAVELPYGGIALARCLSQKFSTPAPKVHSAFGTAKLVLNDVQLEFVMTRSEIYRPGNRFPRVKFAPLLEDCRRRDFTVNALYQRISDAEILDPCSLGLDDLENRLIRCTRDPRESFQEDPLRLLRALRFAAVLDFGIEAQTLDAIGDLAHLVSLLSPSRCQSEQNRLKTSAETSQLERWMDLATATGIWGHLQEKLTNP